MPKPVTEGITTTENFGKPIVKKKKGRKITPKVRKSE